MTHSIAKGLQVITSPPFSRSVTFLYGYVAGWQNILLISHPASTAPSGESEIPVPSKGSCEKDTDLRHGAPAGLWRGLFRCGPSLPAIVVSAPVCGRSAKWARWGADCLHCLPSATRVALSAKPHASQREEELPPVPGLFCHGPRHFPPE